MIIYEVNCLVDKGVADEFRAWLKTHADAVLATDGFMSAEMLTLVDDEHLVDRPCSKGFSIRYRVNNQSSLDHYLAHLAPSFRQEGFDRFGSQLSSYRRILMESYIDGNGRVVSV